MPKKERLRQQRVQRNWRQQEVADQLGVALVTVQRWERGYQEPSAYYRVKLCALFGTSAQELGLLEALQPPAPEKSEARDTVQPGTSPSEEIALWTVPYARNPYFTGRHDLLDQLMQQFSPQEAGQPTSLRQAALTQTQAIKGMGGVGKTQIAIEYAYRSHEQERYTHTLWINAASEEAILASFVTLTDFLPTDVSNGETDQCKLVAAIIRWLEQHAQPWLLIFDNADDLSLIPSYLPSRGNGSILLTTRANAVGALASSVEVDCLGLMEGTQLLLRRAQRFVYVSAEEIDEATNIVVALAHFPLALDQAGAYIEETGCSIYDYFQLYQKHRYALLARRGKQATHYPESVATSWSLSFERIEQKNPAAAELLRLCAFLAPDHIPEELLTEGAPYWPPVLQDAAADRFAFNDMLEALLAYSFVKRLSENRLLSIHRLVQVVQMERMTPQEQRLWAERVVLAVNAVFPRDPKDEVAVWPQCQRYLEQVLACNTLIEEHQLLLPEAAEVLERTGIYLCERALYTLAEPLYQRALRIREQQVGETHPQVAIALNGLAQLYYEQGKYAEAESLRQRALRILEQQAGEMHPHQMVIALNGLAFVYAEQGKYAQAELLYQRALRIWEQQVGSEHPQKAYLLHGLAFVYAEQGKYVEAELLYQQALRIREQQLGLEHLRVAYSLNNLAFVYARQEKYVEAELLYQRALRIREQQLGLEHLKVAIVLNGLAQLYYEQGKYVEAELLYQRALRIWEQQVRSEHPQAAIALHGLANLYVEQGKYAQAEPLYQRALCIREQYLEPEHSKTADVLHDFAGFQQAQGKTREAAFMYQRALVIRERVFGSDHHMTTKTRERLQAVLAVLGGTEEAAQEGGSATALRHRQR